MFYIHIDDPGFPDAPWPGQRRLGPFLTRDEALAQATADAAQGMGVAAGVYSAEVSDEGAHGKLGAAEHARGFIRKRGEAEARRRAKLAEHHARDASDRDRALDELLGTPGVTAADLREAGLLQ